ncbi:unnamed protein product [Brugia timori]|uniref:Uncharacterized protein n=1 Tax=Brugia timori TaxID=42155 RepID=A0A3P7TLC3_9BILA|nr:unnamed protein product [Brugia timori]
MCRMNWAGQSLVEVVNVFDVFAMNLVHISKSRKKILTVNGLLLYQAHQVRLKWHSFCSSNGNL